jgi:hypothetical protein
MASLVIELQQDALNHSSKVSDLLRKALVVARKLKVTEFEEWINRELNGYEGSEDAPKYRMLEGQIKAWNPYHGWVPVMFDDPAIAENLSRKATSQPIGEIEAVAESARDKGGSTVMNFSKEVERALVAHMDIPLPISLFLPATRLQGILELVRNIVLNWALKLEEDGILGEGLTFSAEEKKLAARNVYNRHYRE